MHSYIAIVCKEPGSAWGVHFPDLLGWPSAGSTMQEAVENAGGVRAAAPPRRFRGSE